MNDQCLYVYKKCPIKDTMCGRIIKSNQLFCRNHKRHRNDKQTIFLIHQYLFEKSETIYQKGIDCIVDGTYNAAIYFLTQAASMNHPVAIVWLIIIYSMSKFSHNIDISKDYVEMIVSTYLKSVVASGRFDLDIIFCMGWCYKYGIGVAMDEGASKQCLDYIECCNRFMYDVFMEFY